jgi:hypothetical protein
MSDETEVLLFPVARWDFGPLPSMGMVTIRPHFLVSPMQRLEEAQPSRYYALTTVQVRALIHDLQKALATLESHAESADGYQKH